MPKQLLSIDYMRKHFGITGEILGAYWDHKLTAIVVEFSGLEKPTEVEVQATGSFHCPECNWAMAKGLKMMHCINDACSLSGDRSRQYYIPTVKLRVME